MSNAAEGKRRLISVLKILMEHSDCDHHLTADAIKRMLAEDYGIDADRRSIRDDTNALMEAGIVTHTGTKGVPKDQRGTYYCSWIFEDWELKVLMDAVSEVKCIKSDCIRNIIHKLEDSGGPGTSELLKSNEPLVEPYDYWMETEFTDTFIGLLQAIRQKSKVTFNYGKLNLEKKFELRRKEPYKISPYSIQNNEGSYYIMSNTEGKDGLSIYRIDRIRNLEITDEPFLPPSRLPEGDMTEAVKRFHLTNTDSFSGPVQVVEVRWLSDVREISILYDVFGVNYVSKKNGSAGDIFVIKAQENKGLYNNLLKLGSNIEIIAPQKVRDEYLKIIGEIEKIY